MNSVIWPAMALVAAGFIGGGWLFAHGRLPPRVRDILLTGWVAILFGLLIGPGGLDLIGERSLGQLDPFIALGLGWAGLIFGLQMRLADLRKVDVFLRWASAGLALISTAGLAVLLFFLLGVLRPAGLHELAAASIVMAAALSVSSPTAISMTAARMPKSALPKIRPALVMATLDLAAPLALTGAVFCFFDASKTSTLDLGRGGALMFHSFLIAALLAAMFMLLDRKGMSGGDNLAALIGFIIFSSGVSFYLGVSPLFTNMLAGIILANGLAPDDQAHAMLHATEKPFYVILLVLAGMWWKAGGWEVWGAAVAVVAARIALKVYGARAVSKALGGKLAPDAGLALCSPGAMALAIGLNFLLVYPGQEPVFAFGVIVVSTMMSEAMAPFLIRRAFAKGGGGGGG